MQNHRSDGKGEVYFQIVEDPCTFYGSNSWAEQAAQKRLVEGLLGKKPSTGESFRAHYLTSRSQRGGNVTPNQMSLKR